MRMVLMLLDIESLSEELQELQKDEKSVVQNL